jgi:hypothetical protein
MPRGRLSWASRFRKLVFGRCHPEFIAGFEFRVLLPEAGEMEAAHKNISSALALIAEHDPRRLRRLQRDLKRIWVGSTHTLGEYIADLDACLLRLDYATSAVASPEEIALTIAHEGTHARLAHAGVGYAAHERHRVERVCVQAELDLAERLPAGTALADAARGRLNLGPEMWSDRAFAERRDRALRQFGWAGRFGGLIGRTLAALERAVARNVSSLRSFAAD